MPHHAELPPEESFEGHPGPANDPTVTNLPQPAPDFDDEPRLMRAPLRFGRLALWMASASALGIGVLGTVGYGMWFNHDQRVYAEAMASARKTLGIDQPAIAAQTQSGGVVEAPLASPAVDAGNTRGYASADVTTPTPLDAASLADNPPPAPAADAAEDSAVAAAASDGSNAAGAAALASAAPTRSADPAQPAPPAQAAAAPRRANGAAAQPSVASRSGPSTQARRRAAHATKPEGGLFARVGAFFHRVSYRHNVPNRQREEYSRP
jgi:hypothetical protein